MSGSLRIGRLSLRYRMSARHPAPALVQAGLDRDLRDRLPTSCAAALTAAVPDGEGVVVIRDLDLRLGLAGGAAAGRRLGTLCARAIGRGVARALAGELGPGRVARYPSWADYWASFVVDLAMGAAAERWQYASLAELWTAPAGAALREAGERGVSVVAMMAALARRGRLGLVAAAVAEADAASLLDTLEVAHGPPGRPDAVEVLNALAEPEAAPLGPAALALFLAGTIAARRRSETVDGETLRVVRQATILAVARRSLPAGARESVLALRRRGGEAAAALAELERSVPELAARVLGGPAPAGSDPLLATEGEITPYGGVFLLLPGLAGLDVDMRLTAAGRFLVLLKCLPQERRASAWYDPALCLAAGCELPPGLSDLRALGAPPPPRRTWAGWAEATLLAFAGRLPGFQQSSPDYLVRNFVMGAASYGLDEDGVWASLPQVPLRLVLRMGGWQGSDHLIPWLPGSRLHVRGP